jgi:hypothetical protein
MTFVQIPLEQRTTSHASEHTSLQHWLQRFWPVYCVLAALVTFGYALWDPYQLDGDAVAYMDIGDLIRSHHWAGVINGYWNPLYPAALALGHAIFHATRFTELRAYYFVNFGIFLLEMAAVVCFTDAIIRLRHLRSATISAASDFLFDRYALRYIGVALLVFATQRELSMGKVRPDALLQACLLFGLAALMHHLATGYLRYAALMGVALGFAYLAKSFAFVFTFVAILVLIVFRRIWFKHAPRQIAAAALVVALCFAIVAGPYVGALSHQKGRIDFGDSGTLNYAWFVGGTEKMHLQQNQTALFGTAEIHFLHPEKVLLQSPLILSYSLLPYGTYPDWFDTSFWNDHLKTHFSPRGELHVGSRNSVLVVRYLVNHPEAWLLLIVLLLLGGRLDFDWHPSRNAFWLVPLLLGLSVFAIYGMVNIEERYVTIGYLAVILTCFAGLRSSKIARNAGSSAASALALLLALLAIGQSARIIAQYRRDLSLAASPGGWYDPDTFEAARGLNAMGVGPGDTIACIGDRACLVDHYWARLAGVRILTEIYEPQLPLYNDLATMQNRDLAIDIVRRQGAKVIVGYFDPGLMTGTTPASIGWRELGVSHFYALPLNLPAQSVQSDAH